MYISPCVPKNAFDEPLKTIKKGFWHLELCFLKNDDVMDIKIKITFKKLSLLTGT